MWPFGNVWVWTEAPILGKLPTTAIGCCIPEKNLSSAVIIVGTPQALQHSTYYIVLGMSSLCTKALAPSVSHLIGYCGQHRESSSSTYQHRPTLPSHYLLYSATIHGAVRVSRPLTTLTAGNDVRYSPRPELSHPTTTPGRLCEGRPEVGPSLLIVRRLKKAERGEQEASFWCASVSQLHGLSLWEHQLSFLLISYSLCASSSHLYPE